MQRKNYTFAHKHTDMLQRFTPQPVLYTAPRLHSKQMLACLFMNEFVFTCVSVRGQFHVFCLIKASWNITGFNHLCFCLCLCWHGLDSSGHMTGEASTWLRWAHLLLAGRWRRRGAVAIGNGRTGENVSSGGNLEDHGWALSSSGLLTPRVDWHKR